MIYEAIRERIEKYISGIVDNLGHKVLAIYCMPDHLHLLIGLRPSQSIADLMREVKSRSSHFVNEEHLTGKKFAWQNGYGAFSYARSQVTTVINYILRQPEHHKKQSFKEEYLESLKKFEVDYKPEYLFDWIEPTCKPGDTTIQSGNINL